MRRLARMAVATEPQGRALVPDVAPPSPPANLGGVGASVLEPATTRRQPSPPAPTSLSTASARSHGNLRGQLWADVAEEEEEEEAEAAELERRCSLPRPLTLADFLQVARSVRSPRSSPRRRRPLPSPPSRSAPPRQGHHRELPPWRPLAGPVMVGQCLEGPD